MSCLGEMGKIFLYIALLQAALSLFQSYNVIRQEQNEHNRPTPVNYPNCTRASAVSKRALNVHSKAPLS